MLLVVCCFWFSVGGEGEGVRVSIWVIVCCWLNAEAV